MKADSSAAIRAICDLPIEVFGEKGRARLTRKLVLMVIASFSETRFLDSDGRPVHASEEVTADSEVDKLLEALIQADCEPVEKLILIDAAIHPHLDLSRLVSHLGVSVDKAESTLIALCAKGWITLSPDNICIIHLARIPAVRAGDPGQPQ